MNFGRVLHALLSNSGRVELEESEANDVVMPEMCTAMLVPRVVEATE